MQDVETLLKLCRSFGATSTLLGDHLKIPLPNDLVLELRQAKCQIVTKLRQQSRKTCDCWVLDQWRRVSIPDWHRILEESIKAKDKSRQKYARWILKEVLEDPDYKEIKDD